MSDEDMETLAGYEADLEKGEDPGDGGDGEMAMFEADCHRGHRFFIMYHGTTMESAYKIKQGGFTPSPDGMLGRGVYCSRSFEKARRYPITGRHRPLAVLRLNVRVGKVKRIDYQGHPLQKTWHSHGYATAWVPPNCGMTASGLEEDCVYEPWRFTILDIMPNFG